MRISNGGGDDWALALCPFIGDMLSQMSGCWATGAPEEYASVSIQYDDSINNENVVAAVRIGDVMFLGQMRSPVSDAVMHSTLLAILLPMNVHCVRNIYENRKSRLLKLRS